MTTRSEVFAAYGDDIDALLDAWPNLDPEGYAAWEHNALRRLARSDVRAWRSRQTVKIDRETAEADSGQGRLVDVPPARREQIRMRSVITTDDAAVNLLAIAGPEGADLLRQVALRDRPGAATTLARCERLLKLAELIEAESARQGRPVTVAEVIEQVAA